MAEPGGGGGLGELGSWGSWGMNWLVYCQDQNRAKLAQGPTGSDRRTHPRSTSQTFVIPVAPTLDLKASFANPSKIQSFTR